MSHPPSIVFLDAATVDAGDVSFSGLEALGRLTRHDQTHPGDVNDRCREASIILTNKVVLDAQTIEACPELRYIVITATGTNNVDLEAARARGIPVSNVRGYSTDSVAQHTLCLMLNLATNVHRYAAEPGAWSRSPFFTRLDHPMTELAGRRLGIIGLGDIGSRVAHLAAAFGLEVVAYQRPGASASGSIPRLDPEPFFAGSDFISLHCPLTGDTRHIINADSLGLMKRTSFLVNTSRGPLVDETALADALRRGVIAGAALDVLSSEPPAPDHPLLQGDVPNLIITPHTAWATTQSRTRLLDSVCDNLRAFLAGETIPNRVA